MTDTLCTIFILALALLLGATLRHVLRLLRGRNRRRMFAPSFGSLCDGVGNIGLSVISVGAADPEAITSLLAVEYDRYEVIAVIDSARDPELLRRLAEAYSLVSVDYSDGVQQPCSECVRRLYRSRRRRFRRLTLLDTMSVSPETDADCAASIAVCDYLTVIDGSTLLLSCAIERIIAEICSAERPPHEISTAAGSRIIVRLRDDVAAHGGFVSHRRHFCPPSQRRTICETLAVSRRRPRTARALPLLLVFVAAALALAGALHTLLPIAALLASCLALLAAAAFAAPFAAPHLQGAKAFRYSAADLCEKMLLKILR